MHALLHNALQGRTTVTPETMASICRLAEGNPLFAEELLKSAIERPRTSGESSLPLTITQAVVERTAQFTPEEYGVLTIAAALGRRFSGELLSEITDRPLAELLPLLKRARELQLIVEERDGDSTTYTFRHALTREAIYGELLAAEARPLHARITTKIEDMPDAADRVAELAHHSWLARAYEKAERYNESAAEAAAEVYAFDDAAVFYERAIAAAEEMGVVRPELLTKLGGALLYTGAGERSHKAYLRALEQYERSGSVAAIAETCVGYARMCFNLGDLKMAASMAEKAVSLLGEDSDNPLYFSAQVMLSFILFRQADAPRALEQLEVADRFRGARSAQDEIAFYNHRAFAREVMGDVAGAMGDYELALEVATKTGNAPYQARVLGNMALCLSYFGEQQRSEECAEAAIRIARESGVRGFFLAACLLQYALISLNFGALERARELIERVLASGVGAAEVQIDAASLGLTVALQLEDEDLLGRCERLDLLESAFSRKARRQIASIARAFVEVYVARQERKSAEQLLHRALDTFKSLPDELEEEILPYVAAYGSEADIAPARALLERYVSHVRRPDARGQALLFEAFAARRAGFVDAGIEWAEKAVVLYREIKRPNHEALSLELAEKPREALALYRGIGNLREAHRLELALSPRNRRGRSKDELTQREEQVVALIVQGKSNRAIAEELVLSERTVESHVASIFHKLNVSSRVELVARIAQPTSSQPVDSL
jgi:DNA-binding CsgD family transcriptional regulator